VANNTQEEPVADPDVTPTPTPTRSIDRSFSVAVPVERAWQAMTDPDEIAQWFFSPIGEGETTSGFDLFGTKTEIDVLEVEPLRRFRYSETGGPVPKVNGYAEVTVTFEDVGSGTRITITRSGFGDGPDWDAAIEMVGRGLEESIADCILYVETGVSYPRHPARRSYSGIVGFDTPAGLRVRSVEPDTFGAQLGLAPGDLLVELGGAALFGKRELMFFLRGHAPGERVEAAWVRDGKLHRAEAELSVWQFVEWSALREDILGVEHR
jgi:uncharacterized protein YndB with AHSA1/START domain